MGFEKKPNMKIVHFKEGAVPEGFKNECSSSLPELGIFGRLKFDDPKKENEKLRLISLLKQAKTKEDKEVIERALRHLLLS